MSGACPASLHHKVGNLYCRYSNTTTGKEGELALGVETRGAGPRSHGSPLPSRPWTSSPSAPLPPSGWSKRAESRAEADTDVHRRRIARRMWRGPSTRRSVCAGRAYGVHARSWLAFLGSSSGTSPRPCFHALQFLVVRAARLHAAQAGRQLRQSTVMTTC